MDASKKRRDGFTLVELLVVITVLAVMIAMLLPALAAAKESALRVKCANNLRHLTLASLVYANDNRNEVPYMAFEAYGRFCLSSDTRKTLFVDYGIGKPSFWYCPSGMYRGGTPGTMVPVASRVEDRWFTDVPTYGAAGGWNGNNRGQVGYGYFVGPTRGIGVHANATGQMPEILKFDDSKKPTSRIVWADSLHEPVVFSTSGNWGLPSNTHDTGANWLPLGAYSATVDGHVGWRDYIWNNGIAAAPRNVYSWFGQYFILE